MSEGIYKIPAKRFRAVKNKCGNFSGNLLCLIEHYVEHGDYHQAKKYDHVFFVVCNSFVPGLQKAFADNETPTAYGGGGRSRITCKRS
jgi:hypothetical protein